MRLRLVALVALVTAACSSTSTGAVLRTPTASPSPTSLVTVLPSASASASPGAPDLPLSQPTFSCRLPIMVERTGSDPVSFQGGFLSFPAASFAADPGAVINSAGGGAVLTTAQQPTLIGATETGLPFYDAAQHRWLPVGSGQTSPDGTAYAYITIGASSADGLTLHVVTVATGADHTFKVAGPAVGAPNGGIVEDFDGTSVYFAVSQFEAYPTGIWRLDVGTGKVTAMAQVGNVFAVRNGSAWIGYVDPHDPSPPTAPASVSFFDSLVQVDLATGARTTWFYRPSAAVTLLAVDATGHPTVKVNDGPDFMTPATTEIRHLNDPLSGGEDNGDLVYSGAMWFDQPQPDGDRIWFGNDRGIYLYTPAAGLQKVWAFSASNQSVFPAGFCR